MPEGQTIGASRATDTFRKSYRELSGDEQMRLEGIKKAADYLLAQIMPLGPHPENREQAMAKTKLEECVMWAVKGITG